MDAVSETVPTPVYEYVQETVWLLPAGIAIRPGGIGPVRRATSDPPDVTNTVTVAFTSDPSPVLVTVKLTVPTCPTDAGTGSIMTVPVSCTVPAVVALTLAATDSGFPVPAS